MGGSITKNRAILLLVPLAILGLALFTGNILLWRLFLLSVLVLLVSYLWAWLGLRGIEGQVKKSCEYCQVGESFDEEAVVSNVSVLPKPLVRVWQNTNLPGHNNRLAISLPSRGSHHWQTGVDCGRRGRYRLGPLTVEATDPFGLFRLRRNLGNSQSLLVYPATIELSFFPFMSYAESGSARNYWLTRGSGGAVFRVREYVPGDSLNHIHWRSSAHTGELMVKDPGIDLFKNIWIAIDMSEASLVGDGTRRVEEQCVTIAASLLKKYLDSGRPVGLITEGDDFYLFPPRLGDEHFWRVMEALALVRAKGQVPISQLIEREGKRFGRDSFVVIITPLTMDKLGACLRRINSRDTAVAVIIPDTAGFGGTFNRYGIGFRPASSGIPAGVTK
jgi:uncharacterized protein (DUF58 family)